MKISNLFLQARAFNTPILWTGLALSLAGLLAVLILNTTNWWNITLLVLGFLVLVFFLTANLAEVKEVGKRRSTIVRANMTLVAAAMLAIVLGFNYIISRHPAEVDLSANKINTLSDQTTDLLKKLSQDVDVVMFISSKRPPNSEILKAEDLLKKYSKYSSKFHFRIVDGDKNPAEAKNFKVNEINTVVFQSGDNRAEILQRDYITYALMGRQPTPKFQGESAFTEALLKMTDTTRPVFYLTQGHGERDINNPQPDGYKDFKDHLDKQNYDVKPVTLITAEKIPDDATVLAILGPQRPFSPSETQLIGDYLKKGGKLILLVDPQVKCGLEPLLKDYGIKLDNDVAVDTTQYYPPNPSNVVPIYGGSNIVAKLAGSNIFAVMPFMRSLQVTSPVPTGVTQTLILKTTDKGWGLTDFKAKTLNYRKGLDTQGPVTLGMTCEWNNSDSPPKKGRLVVYGGSNFLTNNMLLAPANSDLGINTFSWAAEKENRISIHPKEDDIRVINMTNVGANIMFYLCVWIIPFATLITGGVVWYRRRSL